MKDLWRHVRRRQAVGQHRLVYHRGRFPWSTYWVCADCGEQRPAKHEFLFFKCVHESLRGPR